MRLILIFLLFPFSAVAQDFDLSTMPPDWSFVSIENEAQVTVTFAGREGAEYIFDFQVANSDGSEDLFTIRTNNASQTTRWQSGAERNDFSANDCVPSLGRCTYTWKSAQSATEMLVVTRMVGDVWFSEGFSKSDGEWLFYQRSCTVYDEYGFWYDYVLSYWDGTTEYAARERPGETRINELWNLCEPSNFTS